MAFVSGNLRAQVSNYTFTQASGGYSAITGGTILGTTANDEEAFNNSTTGATSTPTSTGFPIGFTFYYNGISYDKFAVNTNGFIVLGTGTFSIYATTSGALTPLSSTNTGLVSAISNATHDLQGQTLTSSGTKTIGSNSITGVTANRAAPGMTITGSGIPANTQVTAVSGTTITISNNATSGGSSTCTFGSTIQYKNVGASLIVQWAGYREFNASGDFFNYQIMLSQTTNTVSFLYGTNVASPSSNGTAYSTQVGIRGATNADYDNRVVSTSGNWNASAAGTSNTDVCRLRNTIVPALGQTYVWTPPVPAITSFSPANPCVGSTITITGTNLSGTTSVTIGGTAATILTNTATQITATAGSGTTGTITIVNYGGSATSVSTCTITQQPTALAGGNQAICQTGTATVSGASSSNGTIAWTENGAGSITSGSTTLAPVYTPAAGDAGTAVTLTMTVSNSPCTAATATYIVNVNGLPTAVAGGSQTICQTGTATVSGATASNGTIAWTENGAGSITAGGATLTPVYTPAAGDAGNTVTLTMTVTSTNACAPASATATYTVIVKATPTASAGGSQTVCQTTIATVSGASSSNGTIAWTENGAGSITSGSTTLVPVYTPAAGDAGNTVTLTMTVSNSPCTAATATYTVAVKGTPTATSGGSQTICQTGAATVSGATSSNGTILWTDNGLGSLSNTGTLAPTYTPVAGDAGTTVTLTMTVSNSPCASATATYTVVVKATPTASAGGSQTICRTSTATVSGAASSNGTIAWTENGAGTITSGSTTLTPTYTPVAGDAGNAVTLTMTVSNSPCTVATATYTINVTASPTASAGGSQTICQTSTSTVSGASSSNGTILWTDNGTGSITSGATTLTPTYTPAAGDAGNTVTLTMTVTSNNACAPATATAVYSVVVKGTPTATAGGSQTICPTGTAIISGATSSNGTILWTENGAGTITSGSATLTPIYTSVAGDAGNTVTLTMTVSNSPCIAATATYAVIISPAAPAAVGVITGSSTVCAGVVSLSYSVATVTNATNYTWTVPAGWNITSGAGSNSILVTAGSAGQNGNITVIASNSCGSTNPSFSIDINPVNAAGNSGFTTNAAKTDGNITVASSSAGTVRYGYLKFPLNTIPAGAIINSSILSLTNNATGTLSSQINNVRALGNNDPVSASFSTLFSAIPAGTIYNSTAWGNTGTIPLTLNTNANTDIQNRISSPAYIAMGLERGAGSTVYNFFGYAGTTVPELTVNYSSPRSFAVTVNSLPTITTEPVTPTATCSGSGTQILSIAATGTGITYSWRKAGVAVTNGVVITGQGTPTLTLTSPTTANAGSYDVVVSGTCTPPATSNAVIVTVNTAPSIITNPVSPVATCSGSGTQTLSVVATGTALTYNWRKGGVPVSNGGVIGGQGTSSLTLTNPTSADAGNYDVVVSGTCSPSATSGVATVTVNNLPSIITQPVVPAATCAGIGTQTLSVTATGTALTYNWRKDGVPVSNGGVIGGQGTATLTLANPTTANAGDYDVVVSGTCTPALTSNTVIVTINTAPSITTQPIAPAAICAGTGIQTINVSATGTGLSYSWRKAGVAVSNGGVINGQGTATLTFTNPAADNAGTYDVVVSGTCSPSAISDAITLTVNTAPSIITQPVTPSPTCSGTGTQVFSVVVTGDGLSYSWRKGGFPVADGGAISGQGTATLTLTNPVVSDAGNYDVVITGTCSPSETSDAVTVTVNANTVITVAAAPTSQTVYINDPSPANLTVTATGVSLTYQWFSNGSNSNAGGTSVGAGSGGQTNTYTPPTNVLGTKYYYVVVTGTCGTQTSSAVALTITNTNTWKQGNATTNWSLASNWTGNAVPTGANDAAIPVGNTPYPALTAAASINNLIIDPTATVSLNGFTLTINGNVTGTGTLSGSATSNLITNATSGLLFTPGANTLQALTVNAGTTTLGNALNITGGTASNTYGTVTVATGATLASGGNLTIQSNQFGTARVAAGDAAGNYITGDVTVERYIPANSKRSWRLLSVPTKGTKTIKQTWQENQAPLANGTPGFGTLITSNIATTAASQAAGFDAFSQLPSMQSYNSGTQGWVYVTSTNSAPIQTNKGYFLYIRGDRSVTTSSSTDAAGATVLRTTGTLYQGNSNPAVSIAAGKFEPVGNTFASAVDFSGLAKTGGISNTFYVWDSKLLSGTTLGAYQTFNGAIGFTPATPGGSYPSGVPNTSIESGEAIMLGAVGSAGTVALVESSKIAGNQFTPFRPASMPGQFKTSLYKMSGTTSTFADNNIGAFDNTFSNDVDGIDGLKFLHGGENMSILRNGFELIVEARQPILSNDTLFFSMKGMQAAQQYKFAFSTSNLPLTGLTAFVEDKFLNSVAPIDLTAAVYEHNFSVDATAGSAAQDRFRIVFKQTGAGPLPVSFINISANHVSAGVEVSWTVAAERSIRQYEIESSVDGRSFSAAGTVTASGRLSYNWLDAAATNGINYYRIKSVGAAGDIKYSAIVKVTLNVKPSIVISPNPVEGAVANLQFKSQPKGRYNVRLLSNGGQAIMITTVEHAGGNSVQTLNLPATIARGAYQLEITSPDKTKQVQTLFINTAK